MDVVAHANVRTVNIDVPGFHHGVTRPDGFEMRLDKMLRELVLDPAENLFCVIRSMIVDHPNRTSRKDAASVTYCRGVFSSTPV